MVGTLRMNTPLRMRSAGGFFVEYAFRVPLTTGAILSFLGWFWAGFLPTQTTIKALC